jgi:hypothetical protein
VLIQSLKHQLLHDLKTSWPKTLLLAALFLVGLFFWIPPLVRAVAGSPKGSAEQVPRAAVPQTASTVVPVDRSKSVSRSITWEKADKILATDPLVRSAEVAAIHGNPFQLAPDQFSPPILFADAPPEGEQVPAHGVQGSHASATPGTRGNDSKPDKPGTSTATKAAPAANVPEGLVLKSTILGEKRRAALINDKLYSEGSLIQVDGVSYILTVVRPREVQLQKGEQTFVLALPNAPSSTNIRVERSAVRIESP